ncbi:hypothetical protein RFI_24108 [Reticulomyxa filosa]|uniref:Uncharacterized protein n=1 Tax=Reticulomyxa filosa TaxID=46433 RepID=X6MHY1_RETFI|nr:hypothetical protein RFI_24108 [Reticulomyxa filosa]|eukprot:ETO13266.1 hypothetical protein RFI_24108 [Reticulomyxa filosa]
MSMDGMMVHLDWNSSSKSPFRLFDANIWNGHASNGRQKQSPTAQKKPNFPYYFSQRINSGVYGSLVTLQVKFCFGFAYIYTHLCYIHTCTIYKWMIESQIDLTINFSNAILYYMNGNLLEGYWDMMKTLVRVETLKHIDLLLPDPHLLLVADIVKQSASILSETNDASTEDGGSTSQKVEKINNGKQIKFKSIQIRPDSFFVYSANLKFLKFGVKSLACEQLLVMLDHLFTYYYYNYDNADLLSEFAHLSDRYVGQNLKGNTKKKREREEKEECVFLFIKIK